MNHPSKHPTNYKNFSLMILLKSALSSPMTNLVKINTNLDCNVPEKISIKS